MVETTSISTSTDDPRPLWIPASFKFDELSPDLQCAIAEIVNPAYQELVLHAQTSLERSVGSSYVHLLWLELIEQLELAKDMGRPLARPGTEMHQQKLIQHMRLIAQKDKVGRFLLQTQRFYAKIGEIDTLGRLPR